MGQLRTRKSALTMVGVKNATGSDIAAKLGVIHAAAADQIKLPAATTEGIWGITAEAIANGEWGTIQTGPGKALCTSAGALATIGAELTVQTTGKVAAFAAGGGTNANLVGVLNTTAGGADEDVEVELAAPFNIKQG